jgi:Tol biopolymer transport system component
MHTLSRPIWSPDGRFIAYTYRQGDLSDIYIVALDGSEDRMFIHDGWTQGWMPDGSGLLYAGGLPGARSNSVHLFLANADGTQARQLTPLTPTTP